MAAVYPNPVIVHTRRASSSVIAFCIVLSCTHIPPGKSRHGHVLVCMRVYIYEYFCVPVCDTLFCKHY